MLDCAGHLPDGPDREAARKAAVARLQAITARPPEGATVDDRADALGILAEALEASKDAAGAKKAQEARLALLEEAARSARTPDEAHTFDYLRANTYVALGRGDEAVRMLEQRERELPTCTSRRRASRACSSSWASSPKRRPPWTAPSPAPTARASSATSSSAPRSSESAATRRASSRPCATRSTATKRCRRGRRARVAGRRPRPPRRRGGASEAMKRRPWRALLPGLVALALSACWSGEPSHAGTSDPLALAASSSPASAPSALAAAPSALAAAPSARPPLPAATAAPPSLEGMALVPAGPFTMGADEGGEPDEHPAHTVTL